MEIYESKQLQNAEILEFSVGVPAKRISERSRGILKLEQDFLTSLGRQ